MSLRVNHNTSAINGARNLAKNDAMISKSLERLSSGLRINRGADDAAGLIISEQMRNQIAGINQAVKNGEIAVSMVQTAEGALDAMNNLLIKARELALHSLNDGVNDQNSLVADQTELDNIVDSVNRIANNTSFGTKKLLDGSLSSAQSNSASITSVMMGGQYANDLAASNTARGFHSLDVTQSASRRTETLSGGDASIITGVGNDLAGMSGTEQFQKGFVISVKGVQLSVASGMTKNTFLAQLNALGQTAGFTASMTGIGGTGNITLTNQDYGNVASLNFAFVSGASGATTFSSATLVAGTDATAVLHFYTGQNGIGGTALSGGGNSIVFAAVVGAGNRLSFSGFALTLAPGTVSGYYNAAIDGTTAGATFQIGGTFGQTATVDLQSMQGAYLGVGVDGTFASFDQIKGGSLISGRAGSVLTILDSAINTITVARGRLGAFQAATLEATLAANRNTSENMVSSESTIRDVDFAAESAEFTKNNVLLQSSTAMLAQANQLPQNVLQLLRQ